MELALTSMNVHHVSRVELCSAYPGNGNARTIRIVHGDQCTEITVFGDTDALDALPKAHDFIVHKRLAEPA